MIPTSETDEARFMSMEQSFSWSMLKRVAAQKAPKNGTGLWTAPIMSNFGGAIGEDGNRMALRQRLRVLFVHPFTATFIERDLELLKRFCEVQSFRFDRKELYPALLLSILSADVVVCWFALPYAAVASIAARAIGRRAILIAGGWDVARLPEIGYGLLLGRRSRFLARISLTSANLVLAFSDSSRKLILDVAPLSCVRIASLGIDVGIFVPKQKENIVVTVGNVSQQNVLRKGLRTFVDAAAMIPDAQFIVIGKHTDDAAENLRASAPGNVTFSGWIPDRDLQDILARARVYVQASYTEGFGVALAEAMSSGCVPVVTRRGAIPEVVGDAGIYFEYGDSKDLAGAIRAGLRSELGLAARRRVVELFGVDQRLIGLRDAILHTNESKHWNGP